MLTALAASLEKDERDVIRSVFLIDERNLDLSLSTIKPANKFLVCRFVSALARHCPFEFHFGREAEHGRFNFYIGLGAEWYNYETITDSPELIARDVDAFLRSVVRCERIIGKRGVAAAHYSLSEVTVNGEPLRLTYRDHYIRPFTRSETEYLQYDPWILAHET